jgi:glycosyltransferase involved in cell wall biosynthesis
MKNKMSEITVLFDTRQRPKASANAAVVTLEEVNQWAHNGTIVKHIFRYQKAKLLTHLLDAVPKPFLVASLLRVLSWRECSFEDDRKQSKPINIGTLVRFFRQMLRDIKQKNTFLHQIQKEVSVLSSAFSNQRSLSTLDLSASPVYVRTDLWFGVRAGGSVGHIAGVLNRLDDFTGKPVFLTTEAIPTVREDLEIHIILPGSMYWHINELPSFHFNEAFVEKALALLHHRKSAFIYQRYAFNNYSGAKLAQIFGIPFVLEYNGSEIWIRRHWGKPLKYEPLSERVELLNLRAAHVVVVVSKAMKDELIERGIESDKILVNPNAVDPETYSPGIDGSHIRGRYNLNGKTVVGFIGTFGNWHGAPELAEAFGQLVNRFPEYRDRIRLLMIGDGLTMPEVKRRLSKLDVTDICILTGLVPQEEGAAHMAACDILVAPHVPNPDGTPFFGSPTKLFEYMAMGKPIVASDLDQIGEVLEHKHTAWMVEPGDPGSLMHGIKALIDDEPLRTRLAKAARQEAVVKHTWKEHTRKIIEKLEERCG